MVTCIRLTGWPMAWNWRRAVLSADAGLLVLSLAVEALQGKKCQNSLPSGGGKSLGAKISGEGVVPLPIFWYHSKGTWLRYNSAADIFIQWNFAADFSSFIVEVVQKTTDLGILVPILRKLGRRRTSIDGSLESPCRVLVKYNWTSFSISYGWGATRQNVPKLAAFRKG